MSAKKFLVPDRVRKSTLKLPRHIQDRVAKAFIKIKNNPISGEKLSGELSGMYKLRVGDYRIVYYFSPKESTVAVVKIEHRQGAYK